MTIECTNEVTHIAHLLYCFHGWWRVFVSAQVDNDPGDVSQEGYRDGRINKWQERFDHTERDDVISTLRSITCTEPLKHKHGCINVGKTPLMSITANDVDFVGYICWAQCKLWCLLKTNINKQICILLSYFASTWNNMVL